LEEMEPFPPAEQAPEGIPAADVEAVLKDLELETPRTVEGAIVALCDRFDHMVFDRTLLRDRAQETVSAKECISLLRIEERHDATLINHLEAMMVAPEEVETPLSPGEMVALPGDPELLAEAIARQFSPDQRAALLRRLGEGKEPEIPPKPPEQLDPGEPESGQPSDSSDQSPDAGIEMTI
ncbi:MAG: hypothetical protein ACOC98_13080, partial [Thermodesulfobacteriota bacterium]